MTRSYLVALRIDDFWGLCCLAYALKNHRFPRICPSHDKDPEAGDFLANAFTSPCVSHFKGV